MEATDEIQTRAGSDAFGPNMGAKLRHARKAKMLRLAELAEIVGCSESLLSKIENARAQPSLRMLHKILSSLDMTVASLFADGDAPSDVVMRRGTRPILDVRAVREGEGISLESLLPDPTNKLLYGSIHIVEPGGSTHGTIQHEGEELGYVIQGQLELTVDGKIYDLEEGDSFFFPSHLPHGYRNPGTTQCRVAWINTPSTF